MTGAGNNTYLLIEPGGSASLVDAGVADRRHLDVIAGHLAARGATLESVLVTHGHTDHVAGVVALAASHSTARFFKYPWPDQDRRYPVVWRALSDGDRLPFGRETLVALHTPGHSPDHLAFLHEPTGTVFTGDLVVAGASVVIAASRGGDLAAYFSSLQRLLDLGPSRLLPAHGREVDDASALLRRHIEHRLMRERQVLEALAAGRQTVPSIAESIYHGLSPALMPAARENVRAHLEKLGRERRAVEEEDGRWRA